MQRLPVLICLVLCLAAFDGASAEEPSTPSVSRVDYAKPRQALALNREFGGEEALRKIAATLPGTTSVEKLQAIDKWIRANFAYNPDHAYEWRDFARMRAEKTYGGCADLAILFGSLTRAAGIPTVFVKTMDYAWIRAFVKGPEPQRWSGHCFLEVFLNERWRLLDASGMKLYRAYSTDARLAPGNRYIYDKGLDPYAMVKSVRWALWKKQTRTYFKDFDLSKLPVNGGQSLRGPPIVSIIGAPRQIEALKARIVQLDAKVGPSYNQNFEKWMPLDAGRWIVVLAPGRKPALPEPHLRSALRGSYEDLLRSMQAHGAGIFGRTTAEGTRLFVLWGKDDAKVSEVARTLELKEPVSVKR